MNGKLIDVTRSESISTGFTVIANCSVQNGSCQFQTDHFSYFALVPSASVPIIDTIAPIITLSGATQLSVIIGSGFIDPGATCTDNIDTTCRVTVTGSVNTSQTGSYILTYTARDLANNIATPLLRTVQVVSNSSGENIPTPTPAPTPTPSPVMPVS